MSRLITFLRRHTLWVGFLGALVPLLVLLGLQYSWLVRLEKTSAIAHKTWLANYLETVASGVEYLYRSEAEKTLNLPASLFTQNKLEKAAHYFRKREPKGAKRIFVYSFMDQDKHWPLLFYDPALPSMERSAFTPEARAIYVACSPWRMIAGKGGKLGSVDLEVDERDPENRIILNPITDESSQIVGIAGMIVDPDFLTKEILPMVAKKALQSFFTEEGARDLIFSVRDAKGQILFSTGFVPEGKDDLKRHFSFIFEDWSLHLRGRGLTAEQWARSNFALNVTLSVLLAAILIGGLLLALRAASRAVRLSQMKSDFVSNVSHELRTPLASIRVFGEFLKLGRAQSPAKVQEYGEYIEAESRRLTALINNILDFSKIESGRKIYQFESTDVGEVVAATLKTFEVRLRHQGFEISYDGPEEPLPPVQADPDAVSQAVINLLDNAFKYSDGGKRIDVSLKSRNGFVVISVTDQGIGISREEQRKIFERFHRVSTGLVHDVKGSGLGLSIVHHIVQAHRGRVTVESEPGKGSTFRILLPAAGEAGPGPA